MTEQPKVSVVIVNLNGKQHLSTCFKSLARLDYPQDKLEVIVVDNGSTDGSVELIQSRYKWVRLIRNTINEGFAKPSNDGARAAKGDFVAFLNNDMKVRPDWLKELVSSLARNQAQCAGSVILNWNGEQIDFVGGGINFSGWGYQNAFKQPVSYLKEHVTQDRELLFACGGAMLVDRQIFLEAGGFDEDYFAYYEDVDLGWRLRVMGYRVVLSAASVVYHKHNSTSRTLPSWRVQMLYERNKLYTIFKNYGETLFHQAFFPALLLEMRETFLYSGIDADNYRITNPEPFRLTDVTIDQKAAVKVCALNELVLHISDLMEKRRRIQMVRKTDDSSLLTFFDNPFIVFPKDSVAYINSEYDVAKAFHMDEAFRHQWNTRILIISNDRIGQKMAGTGIRYWEIAKSLADTGEFEVYLGCPDGCDITYAGIHIVKYTPSDYGELQQRAAESNVLLFMGFVLDVMPNLRQSLHGKYVIVDIYDPYVIESLEVYKNEQLSVREQRHKEASRNLNYQLEMGDFFICANEKQEDYWIGMLSALNRINPKSYSYIRDGGHLIETVPFGLSDTPPEHTRNVLKGVWPGIGKDDKVLIWGGGIWNWFDPLTLIRAMKIVSEKRSDIKLFFMGVRHPNPDVTQMEMLNQAVALAKSLGLYDRFVFFNFGWVDYTDRQNYLIEADIGVSCHFDTLETRFSFRTRILDYLWADLPIICTEGDYFAALVDRKKLGFSVKCRDESDLAERILQMIDDPVYYTACRENIRLEAERYKWSRVTQPIVEFCRHPVHLGMPVSESLPEIPLQHAEAQADVSPARVRKGGLLGRLDEIENRQYSIEKMMGQSLRLQKETGKSVSELISWSYMMNNRFLKFRKYLNPVRLFKRLFHRT